MIEYRKFNDMNYAKKCLEQKASGIPNNQRFWEVYDMATICFLMGNFENGLNFFEKFLNILKKSFYAGNVYIEWHETFYNHCIYHIKPYLTSKEAAQKMVLDMIKRRRNYFNSKPSFKKMSKEIFLLS